mmetsp:Transcript_20673/g.29037  ORF Transcript_20673/g.29037 Transcript_20673/m.29037 type:complete len:1181 (+) Transcript_20673:197-3739(+)
MASVTILGFGGRAPKEILEVVSKGVKDGTIENVTIQRSQSMDCALSRAPYRTFVSSSSSTSSLNGPIITLYCLPTNVTEYLQFYNEANSVRTCIMSGTGTAIVYDPSKGSFLGDKVTVESILSALSSNSISKASFFSSLSSQTLQSLSQLDTMASTQIHPESKVGDVVLVIGSGGREHAMAVSLAQSPLVSSVLCYPGNGGTAHDDNLKIVNVSSLDPSLPLISNVIQLVRKHDVKLVAVGPEQPLVDGIVDELAIQCPSVQTFGPSQAAAQLEASKAYSKDFMKDCNIPTASYQTFTEVDKALAYVQALSPNQRVVVKASGLAAGKGVLLPTTQQETLAAVQEIMMDKHFGSAGDTCVIESYLIGPEASCLAFCDGKTAKLMPAAQDHKRALDGDQGLNTGGMGAYAPAPCVTPYLQQSIEELCQLTVQKMAERGTPYVGVLYAGMMLTPDGPYVLEYNCRFGDPETQVLLPLLETDLYEIMKACCNGTLDQIDVRFKEQTHASTVVCAAKGYPESYPKGMIITGLPNKSQRNTKVYHAGTKVDDTTTITSTPTIRCNGGRVLAVTGMGSTLKQALASSYAQVQQLDFISDNSSSSSSSSSLMHYRTDIGQKALQPKLRIGVLGSTRGTALLPIIEACESNQIHAEIVAILSNKRESGILLDKGPKLSANNSNVIIQHVSPKNLTRAQYDAECTSILVDAGVDVVLLVGYMRILSKEFCAFWKGKCWNVHPSLLPKHAGGMDLDVHKAVIDAGESITGCTIHEVTEEVDGGPIVLQKVVQVSSDDTPESLKAKVQPLEGPAFVEALIKKYPNCQLEQNDQQSKTPLSYADAGVDIEAGNELVRLIGPHCKKTRRPGCDASLGGFGGLFDLSAAGYNNLNKDTILIGATDGVGTKLRIAQATKIHHTVGIDLVAMCVNDLLVAGGEPLFFLDYYATGQLDVSSAADVVKGIADGCLLSKCGLIGGETAEMPSMYQPGDYDLAGFAVGAVARDDVLPSKIIGAGDALIGLSSSGLHSNGFSLVRKLIEREGLEWNDTCPWKNTTTVAESLLTPTKIYVQSCLPLLKEKLLGGMAHITGGGLLENLPRSLPKGIIAEITGHPPLPDLFRWLQQASGLDDTELLRTFNCGIGMVLIVPEENVSHVKDILDKEDPDLKVYDLGVLNKGQDASAEPSVVMKAPLS